MAIERGLDIVVLLHGDGQYAPEMLPEMVAPLDRGEADAVFGSRMIEPGRRPRGRHAALQVRRQPDPHRGRERAARAPTLSEFHSGYRAYSVDGAGDDPVRAEHRRLRLRHPDHHPAASTPGKRIVEIPIPTYYGDEICYVERHEVRQGRRASDVVRYRPAQDRLRHRLGRPRQRRATSSRPTTARRTRTILRAGSPSRPPARSSTSGAPTACWPSSCARRGHHVTGVDFVEHAGVRDRVDDFVAGRPRPWPPPRSAAVRRRARRRRHRARPRARPTARAMRERARPGWRR